MSVLSYIVFYVMYSLKALFGVSSLWYLVNGVINAAIISMFLLYFIAFVHSQINRIMIANKIVS